MRLLALIAITSSFLFTLSLASASADQGKEPSLNRSGSLAVKGREIEILQRFEKTRDAFAKLRERTGEREYSVNLLSHPLTIGMSLPVYFEPISRVSLDLASSDPLLSRYALNGDFLNLLSAFNIHIAIRNDGLDWPEKASMEMSFAHKGINSIATTLVRREYDGGSPIYVLDDPFTTLRTITTNADRLTHQVKTELGEIPKLEILRITGFGDTVRQASEIGFPEGISVTYSYRLGKIRAHSDFVWLGRAPELLELSRRENKEFIQ